LLELQACHQPTLATPWPLQVVLDNVIGAVPTPGWIAWLLGPPLLANKALLVTAAALSIVLIAVINAIGSYFTFYYSGSIGYNLADQMRMRVFRHLDRFRWTLGPRCAARNHQHGR
jgi:hypothetical protein